MSISAFTSEIIMLEQELRPYQQKALSNIRLTKEGKGRIIIPTGGGKTAIEAFVLRDYINDNPGCKIHLVLAPRIVLVNQLIKDYRACAGQDYIAVAFHSGKSEPDYEKIKWHEQATTSVVEVKEDYDRAISLEKDLVIFSTYHSSKKLLNFGFTCLIADESQYCVSEGFHETARDIKAKIKLFFTATEKHTVVSGRGLNNEDVFGKILYQITPKELIAGGYIVPPRLHVMYGHTKEGVNSEVDKVIKISQYQHELTIGNMKYSKILFAMNGTADVGIMVDNIKKIKQDLPTHDIFTIISNTKYGAMINGIKTDRKDFFLKLRSCGNAIIFHYDILSEGIDIDGITGIAILRNMNKSKLLQTIGRAVRIYKANPAAKKQAWVSVPVFNGNDETKSDVYDKIQAIRGGGFDLAYEDIVFSGEDGAGLGVDKEIKDQYNLQDKKRAQSVVLDCFHEIEEDIRFETLKSMSNEDLLESF